MFDPVGTAAPFILPGKKILQHLCFINYDWDEAIPDDELAAWDVWQQSLMQLSTVTMPRCLKLNLAEKLDSAQLHSFSDASRIAYVAVTYLRLVDAEGQITVSFLVGKSRVTPTKQVTIPRLELTAAVLAVKLSHQMEEELEIPIDRILFWTDSTIVLQYVNNASTRFQTFIANRLAIIHDLSKPSQWRHVETAFNPADSASRGIKPTDQKRTQEWINGPEFLQGKEVDWPKYPEGLKHMPDEHLEWRRTAQINEISAQKQTNKLDELLTRYSSWYALQKGIAWLLRFLTYLRLGKRTRMQERTHSRSLTVAEIRTATEKVVKYIQRQHFRDEIQILEATAVGEKKSTQPDSRTQLVMKRSKLRKLNPILVNGILRVGGRLERSSMSFSAKHPIILPQIHHVTELIIRHYHVSEGHAGPTQVLATIRQMFWIVHGPTEVRRLTSNCINCQRRTTKPGEQLMAPLPAARVTPLHPPFTFVGVDYFGPFLVSQGRGQVKRYGCLFTCLTMRAVHIEIAHSLDAESFLCAFSRFVSRRGQPSDVFSDNGTNFTAAHSALEEEFEKLRASQEIITDRLRKQYIQWHFNPLAASHMGGVWERLIRSIRRIFNALLQEQRVNDESLLTFMAETERILNDRPLTRQENHPNDLEPSTPNKLLLLRSDQPPPLGTWVAIDKFSKRWRQAQQLANLFWKRWVKEYLPLLQERQKWLVKRRNLKPKDLVLLLDERLSREQWPLGIIEEVHPDKKGNVRQVLVRTSKTKLKRDVRKLCLLEGALYEEDCLN